MEHKFAKYNPPGYKETMLNEELTRLRLKSDAMASELLEQEAERDELVHALQRFIDWDATHPRTGLDKTELDCAIQFAKDILKIQNQNMMNGIVKKHPDCEDRCQLLEHKGYHSCSQTGQCAYDGAEEAGALPFVVQYRRKDAEVEWIPMAAFDFQMAAEIYAKSCSEGDAPWEYRVIAPNHCPPNRSNNHDD